MCPDFDFNDPSVRNRTATLDTEVFGVDPSSGQPVTDSLRQILALTPTDAGWSPVFGASSDGERRVLRVISWTGGSGTPPQTDTQLQNTPRYVGRNGLVTNIAQGINA